MAAQKTEGIILRKYCLRETSYILSTFTKDFGKIAEAGFYGTSVATNSAGAVYITGRFNGVIYFSEDWPEAPEDRKSTGGFETNDDGFITKITGP